MGCSMMIAGEDKNTKFNIEFEKEKNKLGIKILENIENLKLDDINLYKPNISDKTKKFEIKRIDNFYTLKEYNEIKKMCSDLSSQLMAFHGEKFGILYYNQYTDCSFADIYNYLGEFLYRIKEINGEQFRILIALKDGTYLVRGHPKDYIIYIIEDKGYQVLYEINIPPIYLHTHDEKLITRREEIKTEENAEISTTYLGLFEKNENGIYEQKKEILTSFFEHIEQLKDNLMVTKDTEAILFYTINSLELVKKINYTCPRYNYIFAVLNEQYLLIASNFFLRNMFALVDMQNNKVIEFKVKEELEVDEYYRKHPYQMRDPGVPIVINKIRYFPDGSFLVNISPYEHNHKGSYMRLKWDNENQPIKKLDFLVGYGDQKITDFIYFDDSHAFIAEVNIAFGIFYYVSKYNKYHKCK